MQTKTDSQCYLMQLQIDGFLDGELETAQREIFLGHVHSCQACAKELHFAQSLHDAVMDLPLVDCSDLVLEPVHRISEQKRQESSSPKQTFSDIWQSLGDWLIAAPMSMRIALPALVLVVAVVSMGDGLLQPDIPLSGEQAANQSAESYSPEDIQQALQDLNLAIDYLNDLSQRTEVMIGERFVMTPLQESLDASFDRSRLNRQNEGSRMLQDDPI